MNITILTYLEHEGDKAHGGVVNDVARALKQGQHKVSVLGAHGDVSKLRLGLLRASPSSSST